MVSRDEVKEELLQALKEKMRALLAGGEKDTVIEDPVAEVVEEKKEEMVDPEPKSAMDDEQPSDVSDDDREALKSFIRGKHTVPKANGVTVEVFGMSKAKGKKPMSGASFGGGMKSKKGK